MKHLLVLMCALLGFSFSSCAKKQATGTASAEKESIAVAYFSATGTTKAVAEAIADKTNGKLVEIAPTTPYTDADLDWRNKSSRSSVEMGDPKSRPECAKTDVSDCDTIYIGYPIWWDQAPRIVNTWIEANNLKGKVIVPFATSGGSGVENSVKVLKETYPDLQWEEGKLLNSANANNIELWVK